MINYSSLDIIANYVSHGYIAYYAKEVHTGERKVVNKDGLLFYTYDNINYLLGFSGEETELVLPENYNGQSYEIYHYAFFNNTTLRSLTIPYGVTAIGNYAFRGCQNLTDLTLSESITCIGNAAFYECKNLREITIPSRVTYIGFYTFYYCEKLTSVTIPDKVTSIGVSAFESCLGLTSITIGSNVASIDSHAFECCFKLVEVINHSSLNISLGYTSEYGYVASYAKEVHTGESKIVNKDNFLFYTDNGVNYLLGYVGEETELVLPENYNGQSYEIYQYAFSHHQTLTSVIIPNSVTAIGRYAFTSCQSLRNVTIGNSVTSIGDYAFVLCFNLTSVTIGSSVTSIGTEAFRDCYKLVKVINLSSLNITAGSTNYGRVAYYAKEVHSGEAS